MKKNLKRKNKDPNPISSLEMKSVIVTGGGSGGHLFPLQSVCRELKKYSVSIIYIGREHPLEREILQSYVDDFIGIPVGKLRRNWSVRVFFLNLLDGFKVILGFIKSFIACGNILKKKKKIVIYSTGGFAAVPVVISGFLRGIPIVIHEQTTRAGLANRISGMMAKMICISFPESGEFFHPKKTVHTGYPLREEFYSNKEVELQDPRLKRIFRSRKPVILFSGGGNGSKLINHWVKKHLPELLKKYIVCHQTGVAFLEECSRVDHPNYFPLGFISKNIWPALLKRCDILVGRSGAGVVHEAIYLNKKAIFVPLAMAQKNEQYHNAKLAEKNIEAVVIPEAKLPSAELPKMISELMAKKSPRKSRKILKQEGKSEHPAKQITKIVLARLTE